MDYNINIIYNLLLYKYTHCSQNMAGHYFIDFASNSTSLSVGSGGSALGGNGAIAFGPGAQAITSGSGAFGYNCVVSHDGAYVIGNGAVSTASDQMLLQSNNSQGPGGPLQLRASAGATGSNAGGAVSLVGGAGGSTGGQGGTATLQSGSATAGTASGGLVSVISGNGSGGGGGGNVTITTGNGGATGSGGNVNFNLGDAGAGSAGNGGSLTFNLGDAGAGGSGNGGTLTFNAGNAGVAGTGAGGGISFTGGFSTGTNNGGAITFTTGEGSAGGGAGGALSFVIGASGGNTEGADITFTAGAGDGSKVGGDISITAGIGGGSGGDGGDVTITGGDGVGTGVGGDITLSTGTGTTDGNLIIPNGFLLTSHQVIASASYSTTQIIASGAGGDIVNLNTVDYETGGIELDPINNWLVLPKGATYLVCGYISWQPSGTAGFCQLLLDVNANVNPAQDSGNSASFNATVDTRMSASAIHRVPAAAPGDGTVRMVAVQLSGVNQTLSTGSRLSAFRIA